MAIAPGGPMAHELGSEVYMGMPGTIGVKRPREDGEVTPEGEATGRPDRAGAWSAEEHQRFMDGLTYYENRPCWELIAKHFVRTRSRVQVSSHAQKVGCMWTQPATFGRPPLRFRCIKCPPDAALLTSKKSALAHLAEHSITRKRFDTCMERVDAPAPPPPPPMALGEGGDAAQVPVAAAGEPGGVGVPPAGAFPAAVPV